MTTPFKGSTPYKPSGAPFRVLGTYRPPRWSPRAVGRFLTDLTRYLGLTPLRDSRQKTQFTAPWFSRKLSAEVRKRTPRNPRAEGWHQDGDLDDGAQMDHALVLWSSNTPVQIRGFDGTIYQPKPYEIVLIRNLSCYHRRPPTCPRIRWRFRQKVRNDQAVKDVFDER